MMIAGQPDGAWTGRHSEGKRPGDRVILGAPFASAVAGQRGRRKIWQREIRAHTGEIMGGRYKANEVGGVHRLVKRLFWPLWRPRALSALWRLAGPRRAP